MRPYRVIFSVMMGTALTAAAPVAAAADQAVATKRAAPDATAKDGGKEGKLICKRFQDSTSRMKSFKACHTAEEWKRIEEER